MEKVHTWHPWPCTTHLVVAPFSAERSSPMPMIIVGTLGHLVGGHLSAERSHPMPMTMVGTLGHYMVGAFKWRKVMPDAHDHNKWIWWWAFKCTKVMPDTYQHAHVHGGAIGPQVMGNLSAKRSHPMPITISNVLGNGHLSAERSHLLPMIMVRTHWTLGGGGI